MKKIIAIISMVLLIILSGCSFDTSSADDTSYYEDRIAELEWQNEELEDRIEELEYQVEELQSIVGTLEVYHYPDDYQY